MAKTRPSMSEVPPTHDHRLPDVHFLQRCSKTARQRNGRLLLHVFAGAPGGKGVDQAWVPKTMQ